MPVGRDEPQDHSRLQREAGKVLSLADLDSSLMLKPDQPYVLMDRGTTHYYLGEYEKALADLDRSLELRTGRS